MWPLAPEPREQTPPHLGQFPQLFMAVPRKERCLGAFLGLERASWWGREGGLWATNGKSVRGAEHPGRRGPSRGTMQGQHFRGSPGHQATWLVKGTSERGAVAQGPEQVSSHFPSWQICCQSESQTVHLTHTCSHTSQATDGEAIPDKVRGLPPAAWPCQS